MSYENDNGGHSALLPAVIKLASPPAAFTYAASLAHDDDAVSYMRRRRQAAQQLPPLKDGRRDPLDDLAGLPIAGEQRCHRLVIGIDGKWRPCCRGGAA